MKTEVAINGKNKKEMRLLSIVVVTLFYYKSQKKSI
nr:MAG TPA: hypothetical protein [Caudoviricetes sp.]